MSITFIVLTNLYIYIGESYMFCALLKCSVRSCHLIDVLLFSSIVTGIYSGVCCAVLRIDSNSFDGASVIDSVDESNSIVHDGNVQDDSSTYKDCSVLSIVSDMDDSDLLNAMQCLLNIAKKHNDDGLIKALQLSEMSNYASQENDATALQGADLNHDYIIKFLRDNIHTAPYESEGGLLTCAIPFGNNKLIELLIESGAKVNILNADQYMPLHKAVRYGEIEIVKILLNAGADVNHKCLSIHILDGRGNVRETFCPIPSDFITPLQIAILSADFEIVQILLNKKANPNAFIKCKYTPFDMAVRVNSNDILTELILAGAKMSTKNLWNGRMLQNAVATSRSPEVIQTIISNGAQDSIDLAPFDGYAPLSTAVRNKSNDLVKVLINNGADLNWRYSNGDRPLHMAAYGINEETIVDRKNIDIFEILINARVDVNCQNQHGLTPLMIIVKKPRRLDESNDTIDTIKLIISMLLSKGADINMIDEKGYTALHHAAKHGNSDFATLLVNYGANPNIKNSEGYTAVQCAAIANHIHIMRPEVSVVTMRPARMKNIARNTIRRLLLEKRKATQSLSNMIGQLGLPERIVDFLNNPQQE
ncbi:MAG: ankyrin repeat domain-containing protein [Candidatus Endonucleobacter bathymodioli]|uniref:Ankyrin repeat domain-containing protein n=1 Tax=Candidatus Endonucleibacter bathymodioli TaxID=539814 RepID=A0AA90NVX2_9GAMM|nr:ankyrin repeat domain-containing protein [Candidatus Endonucleobacter bathymodioli]